MAGAGYKLFNTGDVLTAAQVNTYLMEQTVMVFDDAAARTTALSGVVSEGMISYLKDTNAVEVYNGSTWVASDDPNAIQNSLLTTTGDIIYASGANTPARLGIGTTGQVLTVSGGVPAWAAAAGGGGKVLQVISTNKTDTFTTNSTTFVDITGLSVSITPSANTSKILVLATITGSGDVGLNTASFRLLRGSTTIDVGDSAGSRVQATGGLFADETSHIDSASVVFLDSPSTTSATTYKFQIRCNNSGNAFVNRSELDSDNNTFYRSVSNITVLEIGA